MAALGLEPPPLIGPEDDCLAIETDVVHFKPEHFGHPAAGQGERRD
jgi:hypothetical protein